jgi:UDP-N-acetylglucosamine--N-acetylmuramyl-(pentapeptide) pyrophosphoryl-undecaprenol N-acetylglucosamine transferase
MPHQPPLGCLIAAGGTAGHVLPSLAVAEALATRGVWVTFAGSPGRVEARLVPEAGFAFDAFEIAGLPRRPGVELARSLLRAARAVAACNRILRGRGPDVVLGGGGYVSGPMVAAAAARRLPVGLMEADAHLGLANRLAAPLAQRVFLAFALEGRAAPRYRVTGRPIPRRSRPIARAEARGRFDLPAAAPVLLVFGGSQGARALNEAAVQAFGRHGPVVLHLSGERDFSLLRGRVARPDYRLLPYTDAFGAALAAADLVLARAGGSVWELAAAGKPAILVPYPHATGDHQTKNARYFACAGGAVIVAERDLDRMPALARALLGDSGRLAAMREAMLRAARPNAADAIADDLIALAERRRRARAAAGARPRIRFIKPC